MHTLPNPSRRVGECIHLHVQHRAVTGQCHGSGRARSRTSQEDSLELRVRKPQTQAQHPRPPLWLLTAAQPPRQETGSRTRWLLSLPIHPRLPSAQSAASSKPGARNITRATCVLTLASTDLATARLSWARGRRKEEGLVTSGNSDDRWASSDVNALE